MTSALPLLLSLPGKIDQPDGVPFGMKKAMALMAVVAFAILVVAWYVGKARARRKPPTPPVYPILDPPNGRPTQPAADDRPRRP